jgi:hypothetical protein
MSPVIINTAIIKRSIPNILIPIGLINLFVLYAHVRFIALSSSGKRSISKEMAISNMPR